MKRRKFIQKSALTAAGTIGIPYILPSGRLFASTGNTQIAEHVVFVLFAGGVRHQEAIGQTYLAESQNVNVEGNVLFNILEGFLIEISVGDIDKLFRTFFFVFARIIRRYGDFIDLMNIGLFFTGKAENQ